ncbi:MAG: EAL domain-containing protein [Hydrogenophilus sp.]|nr:EAL domain-containing protein [Hydrogenophilus sp.]
MSDSSPSAEPFRADLSEGIEVGTYLAILELIDEGLLIVSDETILEVNSAACRWLERDYRELVKAPLETLFPSPEAFLQARARWFIRGESRGSITLALPAGRTREFRFIAAARLRPGLHAILISPDIIRELYRDALHPDAFWLKIAATTTQPIWILDESERLIAANTSGKALFPHPRPPLLEPIHRHALIRWITLSGTPFASIEGVTPQPLRAKVILGPKPGWRVLLIDWPADQNSGQQISPNQPPSLARDLALSSADVFTIVIAPVVDVRTGQLAGAEALLRWHHPAAGTIAWEAITPLLTHRDSNRALLKGLLTHTIAWVTRWRTPLAINLDARQLAHHDTLSLLKQSWEAAKLPWQLLQLEIEEEAFARLTATQIGELLDFGRKGVRILADNVGSSACALGLLARLPVQAMKIAAPWVQAIGRDERAEQLIDGLIHLGTALGFSVAAHGVATPAQRDFLAALGCYYQQGPVFGPTVPAHQPLILKAAASPAAASPPDTSADPR